MSTNQANSPQGIEAPDLPIEGGPSAVPQKSNVRDPYWWIQVAKVRLRFVLIVVVAGVTVSQWPWLRSVWDRWTWSSHTHGSGSVSSSLEYFCPMDPGQISVWPAICPICNMDLVPRKKMEAQMLPEGVIARMQLSPYRIQLAGIRTSAVEVRPMKFARTFSGILRQSVDSSLGFEASISEEDARLFQADTKAEIRIRHHAESYPATVRLSEDRNTPRIRFDLEDSTVIPPGSMVSANVSQSSSDEVLSVPESAVVERGDEQLVFVESMPGVFDGVKVELGRRDGGYYPVTRGLKPGQNVATAGAFLIDAESRLNPSLAASYFGANQEVSRSRSVAPARATSPKSRVNPSKSPKQKLSREDQTIVDLQRICPVTDLPLDSMGGPVPVMVASRKVFICCAGCEQKLKDEPDKYLAKLNKSATD